MKPSRKTYALWLLSFALISPSKAETPKVVLTESFVIERTASENRRGQLSQVRAAMARNEVLRAKAPLEDRLAFDVNHEIDAAAKINTVFGTRNDSSHFNARYQTMFRSGTNLELGFLNSRFSSDSPFVALDPAYESALFVGLRQPVLRDAFGSNIRAGLTFSELEAERAEAVSQREIDQITQEAVKLYWEWVASLELGEIDKQAVQRAKQFRSATRKRLRLGIAEATDRYAAEANLGAREQELLTSQELAVQLLIRLKNLLLLPPNSECSPGEKLAMGEPPDPLEELLDHARENRTDLKAMKKEKEARELMVKTKRTAKRPKFDILTTLQLNAISGEGDDAAIDVFSSDNPIWFIGGEFEIPLQNRTLKADFRQAELEVKRADLEWAELEDQVQTDTRAAWQNLISLQERVEKAHEVKRLQKRKLQEAEKDFNRGRTDALTVILYQEDFLRAERVLLVILAEEALAQVVLTHATGSLRHRPGKEP